MDEARHSPRVNFSPLFVALLGFFFIAIVIAIYHCFAVGWCSRRRTLARSLSHRRIPLEQEETVLNNDIENSMVQLIPVHKYRKDGGLVEGGEEGTCAVCLCEFKEGEEVRILPECLHSFHAPCIDMWLYSHANCPLCRADTTLLLQQPLQLMSESEALPVGTGELQRLPDLSV